jgi:hypothetical protein
LKRRHNWRSGGFLSVKEMKSAGDISLNVPYSGSNPPGRELPACSRFLAATFMNQSAVHESVRLLPEDSVAYRPVNGNKSMVRPLPIARRWAEAVNDPQWGWRIAFGYHQSQEPLPPSFRDQNVRRAYRYLEGSRDDAMAIAYGLRTSQHYGTTRSVLQGFCAPGTFQSKTLPRCSAWMLKS